MGSSLNMSSNGAASSFGTCSSRTYGMYVTDPGLYAESHVPDICVQSLTTGRPPSFSREYIDCKFPGASMQDGEEEEDPRPCALRRCLSFWVSALT